MTLGEYRVGIDFNPGKNPAVSEIKHLAAHLIDVIDQITVPPDAPEVDRLKALAMTQIEQAAMWAVKAATKPERK